MSYVGSTSTLHLLSFFGGGFFLANAIPHIVNGISGRAFQSPFASPPGKGLSSSFSNVIWGHFNLAVGWYLLAKVGAFNVLDAAHAGAAFGGSLAVSVLLAHQFGQFHGGRL